LRYLLFVRNLQLLELFMPETPLGDRDPHEWLSVEQVSNELSVHPVTVREWLRTGRLAGRKAGRRKWRVQRRELQEFLERGASRSVEEEPPADRYAPPTRYAEGVIDTLSPREGSS
jgi:excisionase family DNA binding protein